MLPNGGRRRLSVAAVRVTMHRRGCWYLCLCGRCAAGQIVAILLRTGVHRHLGWRLTTVRVWAPTVVALLSHLYNAANVLCRSRAKPVYLLARATWSWTCGYVIRAVFLDVHPPRSASHAVSGPAAHAPSVLSMHVRLASPCLALAPILTASLVPPPLRVHLSPRSLDLAYTPRLQPRRRPFHAPGHHQERARPLSPPQNAPRQVLFHHPRAPRRGPLAPAGRG